jgi:hypothetical protein
MDDSNLSTEFLHASLDRTMNCERDDAPAQTIDAIKFLNDEFMVLHTTVVFSTLELPSPGKGTL